MDVIHRQLEVFALADLSQTQLSAVQWTSIGIEAGFDRVVLVSQQLAGLGVGKQQAGFLEAFANAGNPVTAPFGAQGLLLAALLLARPYPPFVVFVQVVVTVYPAAGEHEHSAGKRGTAGALEHEDLEVILSIANNDHGGGRTDRLNLGHELLFLKLRRLQNAAG